MKRLPSHRLGAVTSKVRPALRRSLTPLRALPKDRICEDVYPGGFRSSRAGRIYPTAKVIPFPAVKPAPIRSPTIEAQVDQALHNFSPPVSLCTMLFFVPPRHYFAAFRDLKMHADPKGAA